MVYGFAPGDAAEVLKIFSRHGTVVAKKVIILGISFL